MTTTHRWEPLTKQTMSGGIRSGLSALLQSAIAVRKTVRRSFEFEVLFPLVLSAAALVLWQRSLYVININSVGQYGMLPVFPLTFFAALACLVYSFLYALTRPKHHPWLLGINITLLIFILHGTAPAIFPEPRYPWVYKHFGVVEYLQAHRKVNTSIDIYQNWPGFFAGAAWLSTLMGVHVQNYAGWAQVFFNLTYFLELTFIYQALHVGYRVRWVALFLFFSASWVGQDYFSPQAFSLTLSLAVFAIALGWLRKTPSGPINWVIVRILSFRGFAKDGPSDGAENPKGWRALTPQPWNAKSSSRLAPALIALFLFAVIVIAHQLSPYMVLVALGFVSLLGGIKPRMFIVGLAAIAIFYLAIHYNYIVSHFGPLFGGDPFANAKTNGQTNKPSPGVHIFDDTTRILAISLWALGVAGFIRRLRNGQRDFVVGVLAISPFFVLGGQNYGGEAIFRVYLFSLPWFSLLAAYAVLPRRIKVSHRFIAIRAAVLVVGLLLFLSSYFGLEQIYHVAPAEVAAANYFYEHAPPGSVWFAGSQGLPARLNARYYMFSDPSLTLFPEFTTHVLGPADMKAIDSVIDSYSVDSPAVFFAFPKSAIVYAHGYGLLPDGSLQNLQRTFAGDPGWKLWYSNSDTSIYERVKTSSN